jgi:multiple sugar transport system permease protein
MTADVDPVSTLQKPAPGRISRANRRWLLGSLLPVTVIFLLLSAYPVVNLVGLSLGSVTWEGGQAHFDYVGLANYDHLFTKEEVFWIGVRNTLVFAIGVVGFQMVLGFAMALSVMRAGSVGRPLLTGIFLLPIVIPPVVIGTMWRLLLGREFGGVNQALEFIGLAGADWLGDPSLALGAVMFVDIWHWTPFVFLLLLAGLESLDTEVLEAARMDLQTFWQELRYILIPMMAPTLLITLMFRIILSFKVFDEVFLLTSGGPGTATEVINLSIYKVFFGQDRVGDAAAMSVVTLASVTALIVGTNLAIRAWRARSVKEEP